MKNFMGGCLAVLAVLAASDSRGREKDEDDASHSSDEAVALDTVRVTGRRIRSYSADDTLTGTRVPTLLKDLPLSVGVVSQELIEDRGLTQLSEALDNVSGAQRKQGYGGTQNFGAFIRGFDQGFLTLRNGLRDPGFYTLRDVANVERFEVLKGPASILYGAVNPGGITNTITKQPLAAPHARVRGIFGNFDRYRAEADVGSSIGEGEVRYRINAAYEDSGSFRDGVDNKSAFLAPVVAFRLGDATRLALEAEYKQSDFVWDLGLPRDPRSLTVPVERFLGEPGARNDVASLFGAATLEHRISDALSLRAVVGRSQTEGDYNLRSPLNITNDRTVNRVAYATFEENETDNAQVDLVTAFSTGPFAHQLTIGAEHYWAVQYYHFDFQTLAPIDLYAPVYGAQPGPGFPLFSNRVTSDASAIYVQDMISIGGQWKVLLGGRYDEVRSRNVDALAGAQVQRSRDDAFSPQGGVVFQPNTATSLYVSYGRSFVPITSGNTATGQSLAPETGEQIELGVKRELLDGRANITLAGYEIVKQNVSTPDPDNALFRVQTGEQRSRGVELDLTGEILPGWDLILTASHIDAEVTRDNRFAVGSRLPGAPENSAGLWTTYDFNGALKGLSIGGGAYYVDDRQAGLPNNAWTLPSYMRFDAMIAYDIGPLSLQLNLRNLGDERIYDLTGTTIIPQEPRSAVLRATYTF
ncbi:TonB-dependent siderophore receptor [Luteimonas saliphila]|uniref:TonB-dependent siderophore receptor n=1 Tax=Luteimonas saliphila TaxID=2804919 RepID=UPI00192D61F8|nr:TonB-dependent siderophore receptor [Luteimonas saliphila]